uniref:Uncharacterized protein n=1 Tax=Siphoviridae sp. ct2KB1 TaxID=2827768 RepID=A0A8S5SMB4_9CAUD|nr:MAG TPA: hypothetical protein [Siphoviridae sp. ct2KB1]DAM63548.1 MAG TPA: hypothetical protein [Caudoviricetes sp.]DAS32700.1 MAG TPA: hypothetical protein [Caudoviricetes sp.]
MKNGLVVCDVRSDWSNQSCMSDTSRNICGQDNKQ